MDIVREQPYKLLNYRTIVIDAVTPTSIDLATYCTVHNTGGDIVYFGDNDGIDNTYNELAAGGRLMNLTGTVYFLAAAGSITLKIQDFTA